MALYEIEVRTPDGKSKRIKCISSTFLIGKGNDCDLVLFGIGVETRHLEVIHDGSTVGYYDYSSDQPNYKRNWLPNKSVEVGDNVLVRYDLPLNSKKIIESDRLTLPELTIKTRPRRLGFLPQDLVFLWNILAVAGFIGLFGWISFGLIGNVQAPGTETPSLTSEANTTTIAEATKEDEATITPTSQPTLSPTPTLFDVLETRTVSESTDSESTDKGKSQSEQDYSKPVVIGLVDGPIPKSAPDQMARPVAEPTPIPTATVPPLLGTPLEQALQKLHVWVERPIIAIGQDYWELTYAHWLSVDESHNKNYIYIEVLDKNGHRILDQPLTIFWKDGSITELTNKSAPEDHAYNTVMNASGNAYSVKIDGYPSDIIHGMGMGTPDQPLAFTFTSFRLTFQLKTRFR